MIPSTPAVPMHNRPQWGQPRAPCPRAGPTEGVMWAPGEAALWPHLSFLTQVCVSRLGPDTHFVL